MSKREKETAKVYARLANNFHVLRKQNKLTQQGMCKLLSKYGINLHQTAISRTEDGKQEVTPLQLYWLSKHFNFSVDSFMAQDWKLPDEQAT